MINQPLLEISLHLSNGRTHRFVQNDPSLAQQTIEQIGPKIFSRPSLIISGSHRSSAYAAASLLGVSLQGVPEESLESARPVAQEITEADYLAKQPGMAPAVPGEPLVSVVEIEFSSGHRLWLELHVAQASSPMKGRHLLNNIFSLPTLVCRNLDGGLSLWNVGQMVSSCLTPELDAPTNAWLAEFVR